MADEVGLGKTMIAKGVAAQAIDHLWHQRKATHQPITIVYICSNRQIAHQNLAKLRQLTGGHVQDSADRLTMLPLTLANTTHQSVQLVAFTPGTSLNFGTSAGTVQERILLQRMLAEAYPDMHFHTRLWSRFFAGRASLDTFDYVAGQSRFDIPVPDDILVKFADQVSRASGPDGYPLLDELHAHFQSWSESTYVSSSARRQSNRVIAKFRSAMAIASVDLLKPDLVILDEFQRFKELFSSDDNQTQSQAHQLAQQLINTSNTKTLILSATPYKMYTLPDDPSGDDHYKDFTNTIEFLTGKEQAKRITGWFTELREGIMSGTADGLEKAENAKVQAEKALVKVMSRTERLAATEDRSGMLTTADSSELTLSTTDVQGWRAIDDLAQHLGVSSTFEYWRSAPYTTNLMDKTYQFQDRLHAAIESGHPQVTATLSKHHNALLDWSTIEQYEAVDPANPKLRALMHDVIGSGAWRLAWISPSLPYIQPGGVYASSATQSFTKRLIFSAWNVVPKSIAALVSYEAERQAVLHAPESVQHEQIYGHTLAQPIRFAWVHDRPSSLANLTLLYPSVVLARLGDPVAVARDIGETFPLDREAYFLEVRAKITEALHAADIVPAAGAEGARRRWYGVAPFLLDQYAAQAEGWDPFVPLEAWSKGDTGTVLVRHVQWAREPDFEAMGAPPEDLADVLALMAIAGPGVCALRAITHNAQPMATTDPAIRAAALDAATGLRNLFNRPTIVRIIRGATSADREADSYWRQALSYGLDGNLQAVLDEYCHMLPGSADMDLSDAQRAERLANHIHEAASTHTASNTFHDIELNNGVAGVTPHTISSHFAARFGRIQSSDAAADREASVREAFNSPFWPFVLASTSVGQEGLDFHTYCHAVVHWNLPSNPVDLEQREGRVHRYKGHAVRKNIADDYGCFAAVNGRRNPWEKMFIAAEAGRPPQDAHLDPYWVRPGRAKIERYVPAMPLSTEQHRYETLLQTVGAYRFVLGQPRQEELIAYLGEHSEHLKVDLSPPKYRSQVQASGTSPFSA